MTGFGKALVEAKNLSVSVEIKTLNSKFTDIYCRFPKSFSSKEIEVRNLLTQALERGKIEFNLSLQKTGGGINSTSVNREILKGYFDDLQASAQSIGQEVSGEELFKIALTLPEVVNTNSSTEEESEAEWKVVSQAIKKALKECEDFRIREGNIITEKFAEYIENIENLLQEVENQDVNRIPMVRERLKKSVSDLVQDEVFDKNRFEQELIYYMEKFDISEEKIRLRTHLVYFMDILKEGNGKKLNFLSQEIGREINTIGSKANDAIIQRSIVNMKDELEKIKEQTMNIL